jgi:hypothetical protein
LIEIAVVTNLAIFTNCIRIAPISIPENLFFGEEFEQIIKAERAKVDLIPKQSFTIRSIALSNTTNVPSTPEFTPKKRRIEETIFARII